jgi:hypothetical protein
MGMLQRQTQPGMMDPQMWLWICGAKEAEVQVSHYAYKGMFRETYDLHYSNYVPSSNERLEDRAANNKHAKAKVLLIFLVKKTYRAAGNVVNVPLNFHAPNTSVYNKPQKYNELEYRVDTTKLRIEFYLKVLELVCRPRDAVVSIFGGGKVLCSGVVSTSIHSN